MCRHAEEGLRENIYIKMKERIRRRIRGRKETGEDEP